MPSRMNLTVLFLLRVDEGYDYCDAVTSKIDVHDIDIPEYEFAE